MAGNDGFDLVSYEMGRLDAGGGGGGDVTVESKSIAANGTYTAPTGKAYSPVVVSVPNSYAAGDEGKVVSNGALVAQTAHAEVTSNGTIDTTLNNSVVVNVSGGSWTLIGSQEFEVSTSSTSSTVVATMNLDVDELSANDIVWVHCRDKTGYRNGYFYGCDSIFLNYRLSSKASASSPVYEEQRPCMTLAIKNDGTLSINANGYGVYGDTLTPSAKTLVVKSRYSSVVSYTIDGTYKVVSTSSRRRPE